ncbi:hypothetical protein ABMB44_14760 [Levilactobacillus brevis]
MSEVFKDVTTNGKVRPWRERKIENVRILKDTQLTVSAMSTMNR